MAGLYHSEEGGPAAVKVILRDQCWRRRIVKETGQLAEFETFAAFVHAPPLAGLGGEVALLRKVCAPNPEALDMLDRALQRRDGNPTGANQYTKTCETGTVDDVNGSSVEPVDRPTGNSRERAIRKLRREAEAAGEDAPVTALYRAVLAGDVSPHRAMVEAGYRREPKPADVIRRLWAKLDPAERAALLAELARA